MSRDEYTRSSEQDLFHRRIYVNGVYISVTQYNSTGLRRPMVLLHGFTGSASSWHGLFEKLVMPEMQIVALDLLGHGESSAPADAQRYSIQHCRADIIAVLQKLGVEQGKAILLGYSMGGRIALYTAFSGFFKALILESASPGIDDPAEREQRRQSDLTLAAFIEREGVAAFVEQWERQPLFASQRNLPEEQFRLLRKQRLNNRAAGLTNSLLGVGTAVQPSLYAQLPALNIPVLLITGQLDQKFCLIAEHMARLLPQAQHCAIPGAGHAVHLEQPEAFTQTVHDFCTTVL